jgi:hypothetical protein
MVVRMFRDGWCHSVPWVRSEEQDLYWRARMSTIFGVLDGVVYEKQSASLVDDL